jgi:hypothetical protein
VRVSLWERASGKIRRPMRNWAPRAVRDTSRKGILEDSGNVPPSEKSMGLLCANVAGLLVSVQSGGCPPS